MQIQAVPLGFNRNFQGMLVTVPGATRPFRPHSEFFNAQDSLSTNVNGQSRLANNVQLEGVDDNHKTGLLTVLIPSAEAIETVSISTSNYDAEFGRAGGAITNVTLKSGTNTFKGSVFAFGNTEATMASGYFSHLRARDEVPADRASRSAGRSSATGCSSSATISTRIDQLGRTTRATIPTDGVPQRRLQRRADDHLRSADRQRRRHRPDAVSRTTSFPPIASARSRDRFCRICRRRTLRRALGQINYQAPYVRDKTTKSFDVKINQQISEQGSDLGPPQLPEARDRRPAGVRAVRRRRQGLLRHRHQRHLQHRRQLQPGVDQHARDGSCAAASATTTTRRSPPAHGQKTAQEMGIPRREHRRVDQRHDANRRQPAYSDPDGRFRGEPAVGSLRADGAVRRRSSPRSPATTPSSSARTSATTATSCCRRRTTAGRAGGSSSAAPQTAIPTDARGAERLRQRVCVVPARRARGRRPRPQGGEPGRRVTRRSSRSSRTSGRCRRT